MKAIAPLINQGVDETRTQEGKSQAPLQEESGQTGNSSNTKTTNLEVGSTSGQVGNGGVLARQRASSRGNVDALGRGWDGGRGRDGDGRVDDSWDAGRDGLDAQADGHTDAAGLAGNGGHGDRRRGWVGSRRVGWLAVDRGSNAVAGDGNDGAADGVAGEEAAGASSGAVGHSRSAGRDGDPRSGENSVLHGSHRGRGGEEAGSNQETHLDEWEGIKGSISEER